MNFDDTPAEAAFRREARRWLDANVPRQWEGRLTAGAMHGALDAEFIAAAKEWQKTKFDAGWACLHWAKEHGGRGASPIERVIWGQEEGAYAMLSVPFFMGHNICAAPVMAFGTEMQKRTLLPRIASGEDVWCQLFSEPAGGSDLAGLRTRAVRDGGDWIVNGQKIWTSFAHFSDRAILLTRTDPTVAKHKGLTMFLVDMRAPGLEVRPVRQANGQAEFNEVFFTNLRIPDADRIGLVGGGWHAALTTLMNERQAVGGSAGTGFDDLFDFCCQLPMGDGVAADNAAVQSRLAHWAVRASGLRYTSMRTISALSRGETPGPEESIGKLVRASMMQEIAMFAIDLQGEAGALWNAADAPYAARFQAMLMRSPGTRIEGGTDEILRNIIAERVLGLPQDVRVDKDVPFNQIPAKAR